MINNKTKQIKNTPYNNKHVFYEQIKHFRRS